MNTKRTCPECGKPVPPNGLQGLCPECMMKVGLAAQTGEAGPGGTQVVPPQPKPPPTLAEVAQLFPQLEILESLGCGGMGAVYKARQPRLDRLVALKILTGDREDATRDARFAERFEREARALAKLSHPNIVAMYEFGQAGGMPYFVMEHVEGLNLRQLEQAGKLSPREALQIIPQICAALQFAHDEGIVHRDIKPENILLDKKGRVKIADFGIAKILGKEADRVNLTAEQQVIGTPHYMAPEQVEHPQQVDHRADIYSLGVVFYEMLTGELPLGKFQPPSRKVQIDVRLDEIVLHALEKEPARRYQHASEVKTDVETIRSTAAPLRSSADDRSCRIPGTNLALVESRHGQRRVNWTNFSLAWILLMLAGALGLGLIALIANQIGFYVKPDLFQTAGVVMTFVCALVVSVAVRLALVLPADEFEPPTPSAKAASETLDLERVKNARRLVKWPATGLMAIGLSYLVAAGCFLGFGYWPANWQGALVLCCLFVINYVIILGSSRMRQLQDYRMAVLAAIVSLVVTLPGLPLAAFPIWALMVLYRPDVRAAFNDVARKEASPASRRPWSQEVAMLAAGLLVVLALVCLPWSRKAQNSADAAGGTRIEVPPAVALRPEAVAFGPVREVTLNDMDDSRGGDALDFGSRQLLDLPKDIKKRPENEQLQWLKEHSVDVLVENVYGRWGLLTTMDNKLKLAPLPNEKWEVARERDLSQALAGEPSGLETKQLRYWTVYVLATNAQPPLTFAFQTGSGTRGLLQITAIGPGPHPFVQLHYKAIEGAHRHLRK